MEIVTDPEKITPGQDMKISFTYKPEVARLDGKKRFEFTILPLNQAFSVTTQFDDSTKPASKSGAPNKKKAAR
jgi:hypothetical protein